MKGGGDTLTNIILMILAILFIFIGISILIMYADQLTKARLGTAFGLIGVGGLIMVVLYWYNSYTSIQGF